MGGAGPLQEKVSRILRDLEIDSLRILYRTQHDTLGQSSYFYSEPYELAWSPEEQQAQLMEAEALNRVPGIIARRLELAADGIWPEIVSYSERGNSELTTIIRFNERGRRTLARSGLTLSTVLRVARRFLWLGYVAIGVTLVVAWLDERVWRSGWLQALVSPAAAAAFLGLILLIRRLRR
ncbi:MAG: hypothetical protein K2Z80_22665 [Xanthobacteraceae bacterium]|nr:hypothetical protein [Xanthobacteraceae bacterium]